MGFLLIAIYNNAILCKLKSRNRVIFQIIKYYLECKIQIATIQGVQLT
jgi:hypothetical protein